MKDPRDIILAPVVSEKSYGLSRQASTRSRSTPTPPSPRSATPSRRSAASRSLKVNTLNRKGKRQRNAARPPMAKRADTKRAIVTLAAGERIDLFES